MRPIQECNEVDEWLYKELLGLVMLQVPLHAIHTSRGFVNHPLISALVKVPECVACRLFSLGVNFGCDLFATTQGGPVYVFVFDGLVPALLPDKWRIDCLDWTHIYGRGGANLIVLLEFEPDLVRLVAKLGDMTLSGGRHIRARIFLSWTLPSMDTEHQLNRFLELRSLG